jgi:flavin-dependent thymidylate synthase
MSKVQLVGHYGSDEQIALAAWTSTSRELTEDKIKRIPKMIETLYSEGHKTPFERGIVHFLVEADIASHIHLIKHRHMGTNGESARYKELKEDKMYIPEDWKFIKTENKEVVNKFGTDTWIEILEEYTNFGNFLYHEALKDLTPILGRKRAKESARYFKTYNSVITTDCIMNISCFANFYKLRHSDKAQKEISDIAEEMMILLENIEGNPFETTLKMIKS